MTLICQLNIDGQDLSNAEDKVAAFVNGQVRGVSSPSYVASADAYYTYMTIFSNNQQETISFRIYDSATATVRNIGLTIEFLVNQHIGTLFQSLSIASPRLSNQAEIVYFSFVGAAPNNIEIDGNNYTLYISNLVSKEFLVPEFTLSDGADMFINQQPQISRQEQIDFTNPVVFQVRSEDRSTLNTYTLNVEYGIGPSEFDGEAFLDDQIYISEYLSPNGDDINDAWKIININYHPESKLWVYSRTGQLVYNATTYNNDWRGTYKGETLPEGNYYYQIDLDGNQTIDHQGWIYLSQ
jgi:gliding motility-associated-like protein